MNTWMATVIVSSISLAAVTSLALADTANSPPSGDYSNHHGSWSHHHEKSAFSLPSERIEARLAYIKTALKITDAQEPQWEAFADAQRRQAQADDKKIQEWQAKREQYRDDQDNPGSAGEGEHGRPSAIDRIEHQKEFLSAALTRLDAKLAALKPLYEVLSEDQKRVADEVLGGDGHHHRHGWGPGNFEHSSFHQPLLIDLHRLAQI